MTDIDQALAEIKRRAERTDLKLWSADDHYIECICIREDALREALAPLCAVVEIRAPAERPAPEGPQHKSLMQMVEEMVRQPEQKDSLRGGGVEQPNAPSSDRASTGEQPGCGSFQCPACRWHEGHDPAEWFRGEVSIYLSNKARDPQPKTTAAPSSDEWILVPREPTVEMLKTAYADARANDTPLNALDCWHSMVDVAPEALSVARPPAAVVDYTERAQRVWHNIADGNMGQASSIIRNALSAIASERDAEIAVLREDVEWLAEERAQAVEAKANGNLIAAASDLYEALTNLLAESDPYRPGRNSHAELNARAAAVTALAKAAPQPERANPGSAPNE